MKKINLTLKENIKIKYKTINEVLRIISLKNRKNISKQKNRGEVSYSNKKPWKQKGTGNARSGRKSSPVWIKGGRAFTNSKENFSRKVNKRKFILFKKMFFLLILKKTSFFFININTSNILEFKKTLLIIYKKNLILEQKLKNRNIKIMKIANIKLTSLIKYNCVIFNKRSLNKFLIKYNFIKNEY
ncbi:50S ribosomal protein L4 [Candidatus Vidania fulgoroideorum]